MIEFVGQREDTRKQSGAGDGPGMRSSWLEYLPAFYRDSDFMGQFLLIFESVLRPIENTVDNLPLYFDPRLTPDSLLTWLASWLDLVVDSSLPIARRRELLRSAAELYRWRGTRRGLSEYIRICTGIVPDISEHIPGMTLGPDTKLGIDTRLGSSGTGYHFTVRLKASVGYPVDTNLVKTIIDAQKPAHAVYTLQLQD